MVEDGYWLQGATTATDWKDFRTTTNKAYGTQTGTKPPYDDSAALRVPRPGYAWSADQDVRGRIYLTSRAGWGGGSTYHEVELLLRGSMGPGYIRTYEVIFSTNAGTTYCEIVRWNGPLGVVSGGGGAFTSLRFDGSFPAPTDGLYIRATMIGTVISGYTSTDGSSWSSCITPYDVAGDSVIYTAGYPGMGHWKNDAADVASTYGLSWWSAQAA